MTQDEILRIFGPVLTDALTRLRSRSRKVDNRDVTVIFTPVFQSIAKAAGANLALATARLTWAPSDVTEASLRDAVRGIVDSAIPAFDTEAMRRKQEALERELSAVINSERPSLVY